MRIVLNKHVTRIVGIHLLGLLSRDLQRIVELVLAHGGFPSMRVGLGVLG